MQTDIQKISVIDLRVDGLSSGAMFCPSRCPSLSWRLDSSRTGAMQKSYQITAHDDCGAVLWDSGVIESDISTGIRWEGAPLASRTRVTWTVTVTDDCGNKAVSENACFETPLFSNTDWSAQWIWFDGNNPSASAPLPYFRKEFSLKNVVRARLYAGCRGIFKLHINGQPVSADRLAPGWTDFNIAIQYLSYDVTALLNEGQNTLGAIVGDGWYCSYLFGRRRNIYGEHPELLLQLEVLQADGTTAVITTGPGWRTATGPYLRSDIYDGEFYDARLEMPGWDCCGFDDSKWREARVGEPAAASPALVPKCCLPVQEIEEIKPVKFTRTAKNELIWDFGQNISGGIRIRNLRVYGNKLFTIKYGEMLNPDGSLYNQNFRSAISTDYYTTKGTPEITQEYETAFTFHGFRYVQIEGPLFSCIQPEDFDVTAVVIHSVLEKISSFECGHAKINRLYSNICWGQRDNFLEIPTDCPQRDERLGWTGDAQMFCGTAALNMNVGPFFRKYLRDLHNAQKEDGSVPSIAPNNIIEYGYGAAAWADAAAVCPWTIYMAYGDPKILEENFEMMHRWVDYQRATAEDLIRPKTLYGDWLSLSPVETPSALIGTAYFVRSAEFTARAAAVLGRKEEADYYGKLSDQVREAFCKKFLDADGMVTPTTQTALALALHFNILPENLRERNSARLGELIRQNGKKLNTGFVGTGNLNLALSEHGMHDLACDLYLQEEYPSWLFSVNQGATTMWERWNSYTVKDGFGDVNMNSFNHYAYGAVHEWAVRHVCGIRLTAPGGKEICFAAEPDKRLKFVNSSLKTPYGEAVSHWRFEGEKVLWHISAPANTRMQVMIPAGWTCNTSAGILPCGSYDFELVPKKEISISGGEIK